MRGWTIRRYRLPKRIERFLDSHADHYRVTMSDGRRIVWLGFGAQPDDAVWLPVALEQVEIHGKER